MKNILLINACVRSESRTRRLAQAVLNTLEGKITEVALDAEKISPMDGAMLAKRNALVETGNYKDNIFSYAKQFSKADTIVIAAPYWDLSFPALLKCYLEAVTVSGITFAYSAEGFPISLCKAKKLIYVTTSGGPIGEMNFGFDYVKAMASGFFGIKDVEFHSAENLDIVGVDAEGILQSAISKIKEQGDNSNENN